MKFNIIVLVTSFLFIFSCSKETTILPTVTVQKIPYSCFEGSEYDVYLTSSEDLAIDIVAVINIQAVGAPGMGGYVPEGEVVLQKNDLWLPKKGQILIGRASCSGEIQVKIPDEDIVIIQ